MLLNNDGVSKRNGSASNHNEDDGSQCNMNKSTYGITTANEKQVSDYNFPNKYVSQGETQVYDGDNENV